MDKNLPEIEFDGHIVKPKRGVYHCPHKCGDHRFNQPSWKTESGFRKHMMVCRLGSEGMERKALADNQREVRKEEFIAEHDYAKAVGDEIYFVHRATVKPAYKNGRRVRYEDVYRFQPFSIVVEKQTAVPNGDAFLPAYHGKSFCVLEHELQADYEAAKAKAEQDQKDHDEHLRFSSFCR